MASKWEVLEYLRRRGGYHQVKEVKDYIEGKGGNSGVRLVIKRLTEKGVVNKYFRKVKRSSEMDVPDKVMYKKTDKGRGSKQVYIKLSEDAYNILDYYDVDSFYDIPGAKESNIKMMIREDDRRTLISVGGRR